MPNLTLGAPIVKALRRHTTAFLDCHLMVSHPEAWVDEFADAGASNYTFHIEAAREWRCDAACWFCCASARLTTRVGSVEWEGDGFVCSACWSLRPQL